MIECRYDLLCKGLVIMNLSFRRGENLCGNSFILKRFSIFFQCFDSIIVLTEFYLDRLYLDRKRKEIHYDTKTLIRYTGISAGILFHNVGCGGRSGRNSAGGRRVFQFRHLFRRDNRNLGVDTEQRNVHIYYRRRKRTADQHILGSYGF